MSKLATDLEIAKLAWSLYCDVPISVRLLASARTYICPMQPLLAEVPKNSTLFDIGCGSGLFLSLLIANGQVTEVIGSDANPNILHSAKAVITRLAKKRGDVTIDLIKAEEPKNWPDTTFSVVSLIDVMHHVPPQKQRGVFEAAAQRVCPGGRLLYKDMCQRPLWRATANRLHDLILARQWIHYVSIDMIKNWGRSCGLELEKEAHYSRYVYGHEKLVFKKEL